MEAAISVKTSIDMAIVSTRVILQKPMYPLSLIPTCPYNHKNGGFLRFSNVWDPYDQWEHRISDIPDGRRFLRCDRKNRKHFY